MVESSKNFGDFVIIVDYDGDHIYLNTFSSPCTNTQIMYNEKKQVLQILPIKHKLCGCAAKLKKFQTPIS